MLHMGELHSIQRAATRRTLRIVLMSDTHLDQDFDVPEGDLLLHSGDLTHTGTLEEAHAVGEFLRRLPHRHKVVIAGNHDRCFEEQPLEARAALAGSTYLLDQVVDIEGLRIYGSPWQPWHNSMAFNRHRGAEIRSVWSRIPSGIDILMTHGPAMGQCDLTSRGVRAGCEELAARIRQVKPLLHVCGHIHEARGVSRDHGTLFVNASITAGRGLVPNRPIVVDWNPVTRDLHVVNGVPTLAGRAA